MFFYNVSTHYKFTEMENYKWTTWITLWEEPIRVQSAIAVNQIIIYIGVKVWVVVIYNTNSDNSYN